MTHEKVENIYKHTKILTLKRTITKMEASLLGFNYKFEQREKSAKLMLESWFSSEEGLLLSREREFISQGPYNMTHNFTISCL